MIVYAFAVEGLDGLEDLNNLDPAILDAAKKAVNATAPWTRTRAAEEMRRQVNFPASYLRGDTSRLQVTDYATANKLEAVITGRQRPTSLARFVSGRRVAGTKNPSVEVRPGRVKRTGRAFLMKLRSGTEPGGNLGLAVRTASGRAPDKAYKPTKIAENLYLVYGPSVDQVFRSVREDVSPKAQEYLEAEFNRLLELK